MTARSRCLRSTAFRIVICLLMVTVAGVNSAIAQLNATLIVVQNPSPYLSDWAGHPEYVQLNIVNPTQATFTVQLEVTLSVSGNAVARSKPNQPPPFQVPPGVTRLVSTDIVTVTNVDFFGSYRETALRTGLLPSGAYDFCIKLFNRQNNTLLTQQCRPFTIQTFTPPVLLQPVNNTDVQQLSRPMFRWTSILPKPQSSIIYKFALVKMLQGQTNAVDAFRTNRPILERDVRDQTQLLLPIEIPNLDSGARYVWSVRAVDANSGVTLIQQGDGWAQPFVFRVIRTGTTGNNGNGGSGSGNTNRNTGGGTTASGTGNTPGASTRRNLPPRDTGACGSCRPVLLTDSATGTADLVIGDTVRVGKFNMIISQLTNASPTGASGQGAIAISWLFTKVLVEFSNLRVNGLNQMKSGTVKTVTDPLAPMFPRTVTTSTDLSEDWSKQNIAAIDGYAKGNNKISSPSNPIQTAMVAPIGINNVAGYTLCIPQITFTKDYATMTAIASIPIPDYDDTLAFGVSNVRFCPEGLSNRATLELLNDFELRGLNPTVNSFKIILKSRSETRQGCYVSWNCSNFDTLSLDADVVFPRTWLTPRPDNDPSKQVSATFSVKTIRWKDILLRGSLARCTIEGTNGMGLEIQNLALDLSSTENAPGMVFPANYVGTKDVDFTGLYADNLSLILPDGWNTFNQPDRNPTVTVQNLIITRRGLTGDFLVSNVIQFPSANIARMSGSLDTVCVSLINTSLTQAYFCGKVNLPLVDANDVQASLAYKALINIRDKRFDFSINPDKTLTTNLFAGAQLQLLNTSQINITLSKTTKSFTLKLNGSVGWNNRDIQVPGTQRKIKVNFAPKFENLMISYNDTPTAPRTSTTRSSGSSRPTSFGSRTGAGSASTTTPSRFTFSPGTWSFASPQKSMAGFPVSINNIVLETAPAQPDELCAAQLRFQITVNLDSGKIGGNGAFRLIGAINRSTSGDNFSFAPRFKDFKVDRIDVFATMPSVAMRGFVEFYDNDTKWGTGFFAAIKATFQSAQLELNANARFGRVQDYRYWYVEAKAIVASGIPFMTGYAFYGAGLAAWYHVNVDMTGTRPSATNGGSSSPSSGASMRPDKNTLFGFRIMAVLGTSPDPARMNADIGIAAQFSSSGGISQLAITGDLWMMANFANRPNAPVRGSLNISYDFVNKIFDLNASVVINRQPITGNGTLKINVNDKTRQWYVKIGDPTQRVVVNVNMLAYQIRSHSYFMFGNNIQPPSGFMSTTTDGLRRAGCPVNSSVFQSATNSVRSGPGFAAGVQVGFGANGTIDIGVAGIDWNVNAGFEANLSMLRYDGTPCPGFTGYNQWYCRGSVAIYGSVAVVLRAYPWNIGGGRIYHPCCGNPFKRCAYDWSCYKTIPRTCIHCCSNGGCRFNLATINLGAYMTGGLPNPAWVTGNVSGNYNVLGGLIKGTFSRDFTAGTRCTP